MAQQDTFYQRFKLHLEVQRGDWYITSWSDRDSSTFHYICISHKGQPEVNIPRTGGAHTLVYQGEELLQERSLGHEPENQSLTGAPTV